MNSLSVGKIKEFFPGFTRPCLKNFVLIMECILQSGTVCLYKCKDKASLLSKGKTTNENSFYIRLIRFFKIKNMDNFLMGIRCCMMSIGEMDMSYLIIDRSNWNRGLKNINLLTIGNLIDNIFTPLFWVQMDKKGNSNTNDRIKLIERFIEIAGKFGKTISGSILLADREFIGQNWFEFLLAKDLSFVIRLREKMYFELQTHTGKKNFIKVISQAYRKIWNIQHSNDVG